MNHAEFEKLDGNEVLMYSLLKGNKSLVTHGNTFQGALEKEEKGKTLNQSEQNAATWFNSLEKGYPGRPVNKRSFVVRNHRDLNIIKEIENQEYHGLKKTLEVMLKDILSLHLQETSGIDSHAFLTSDYDDIKSGIDAIIEIKTGESINYVGVDFCVSKNQDYIYKKGERNKTTPREFSHHKGKEIIMNRIVKDFNPEIISLVFSYYLKEILAGKDPSINVKKIYTMAKEHVIKERGSSVAKTVNTMQNLVETII